MVAAPLNLKSQLTPEIFSTIRVCTLSRSIQSIHLILLKPIHGRPHIMKRGVVILDITIIERVTLAQRRKYIVVHNSGVKVGVELTIKWDEGPQFIP
ncbi:hypothetical protein TNCV_2885201 [Trichonephila clavipes]|nr:hypothetical protein TNCV_2885201 [Trichonephila clavipes]